MNPTLPVLAVLGLLALSGCGANSGTTPAGVTQAQAQACRERTDEVFLRQNRGELFRADNFVAGTRDTPMSGGTGPSFVGGLGAPTFSDGLGGQFARARALNDCLNAAVSPNGSATPQPAKP